ncbi:twin-arginine translocation signal domain-containing protein [Micromonospora sp. NPDC127501]|uniref:twin-arginine translocation signal domain-containing protein n=1 Tax=Micromonospora sp. NPDC127501 TaxID=3154872 RepID=UPI00331A956E
MPLSVRFSGVSPIERIRTMRDLSRRDLLRATAVGAGAVAIPSVIAGSSAVAADGPRWPSDTGFRRHS